MIVSLTLIALKLITLLLAILVVIVRSPIHAIWSLILTYISAASILFILNLEFLAFVYILLYIGAIAVLFLFIIMMLNLKEELSEEENNETPTFIFLTTLVLALFGSEVLSSIGLLYPYSMRIPQTATIEFINLLENIVSIKLTGLALFSLFYMGIIIIALILLVIMMSIITFTLEHTRGIRRQDIYKQNARLKYNAIKII